MKDRKSPLEQAALANEMRFKPETKQTLTAVLLSEPKLPISFANPNHDIDTSSISDCSSRDYSVASENSIHSAQSSVERSLDGTIPPWHPELQPPGIVPDLASIKFGYDLPCEFDNFGCNFRFDPSNWEAWISHSETHFCHNTLPALLFCPVCLKGNVKVAFKDWRIRMIHLGKHFATESIPTPFPPDFSVIRHLLKYDLISSEDFGQGMRQIIAKEEAIKDACRFNERPRGLVIRQRGSTQEYRSDRRTPMVFDDLKKQDRKRRREQNTRRAIRASGPPPISSIQPSTAIFDAQTSTNREKVLLSEIQAIHRTAEFSGPKTDKEITASFQALSFPTDDELCDDPEDSVNSISNTWQTMSAAQTRSLCPASYVHRSTLLKFSKEAKLKFYYRLQGLEASQKDLPLLLQRYLAGSNDLATAETSQTQSNDLRTSSRNTSSTRNSDQRATKQMGKSKRSRDLSQDDKSDGERSRSPSRSTQTLTEVVSAGYACPFRKRKPRTYCSKTKWRNCAETSHPTIARVKGHLYRYHRVHQCRRCKIIFDTEDMLEQHELALEGCPLTPETEPVEGVTARMKQQLQNRAKTYPGQTREECWNQMYRIIFPGESLPNDPYFVHPFNDLHTCIVAFREQTTNRFAEALRTLQFTRDLEVSRTLIAEEVLAALNESFDEAFAAIGPTYSSSTSSHGLDSQNERGSDSSSNNGNAYIAQQEIIRAGERMRPADDTSDSGYVSNGSGPISNFSAENRSQANTLETEYGAAFATNGLLSPLGIFFDNTGYSIPLNSFGSSQVPDSSVSTDIFDVHAFFDTV